MFALCDVEFFRHWLRCFFFPFRQSGLLLCLLIAVFRDWTSFLWVFRTAGRRVAAVWLNGIAWLLLEVDACLWKVESIDDCTIVKVLAWPRLIWLGTLSYWNIVNIEISIRTTAHNTILYQRRWSVPCFRKYPIIKSYNVSVEGMQYVVTLKKVIFFFVNSLRWYRCCFMHRF